jgi:hypothetical protein
MKAKEVSQALGLSPGELASILKREVVHQHLAQANAMERDKAEYGGYGLEHIAHLHHLIVELEAEWERQHPEEDGRSGSKEATSAAAPTPIHRSRGG